MKSGVIRRGPVLLAMIVAGAAVLVLAPAPAGAQCMSPSMSVRPSSGPPGQRVTISGQNFFSVCSDIAIGPTTPPTPERNIRLEFVQSLDTVFLGNVDADSQGRFSQEVSLPLTATPGSATIRARGTNANAEAAFQVTPRPTTTSQSTTTTTTARTTTTTSQPTTTTTMEQTFPTLEPASTTTPTVKLETDDGGSDWSGWIVLGIVGVGLGIFAVSWRILRTHPPSG